MSKSRTFEDYLITTVIFQESHSIFVQFYNTILHKKYENTIPYESIGLPGKLSEVFTVINLCFDKKEDYTFGYAVNGDKMGINFEAKLGGILTITFNIVLEETNVSSDSKISYKLNELESTLAETKAELAETKASLFEARMRIEENTESIRTLETNLEDTQASLIIASKRIDDQTNTISTIMHITCSST